MTRRTGDIIHTIDEPNTPLRNQRVTIIRILERGYYCQNAQGREGFIVERHITDTPRLAVAETPVVAAYSLAQISTMVDLSIEQMRPALWDGRMRGYKDKNGHWRVTLEDALAYKAASAELVSGHAWREGRFKTRSRTTLPDVSRNTVRNASEASTLDVPSTSIAEALDDLSNQ